MHPRKIRHLQTVGGPGTRVATLGLGMLGRSVVSLLLPSAFMGCINIGCLVTDPIEFPEEQNYPPSIATKLTDPHPLHQIIRINTDERTADGGVGELTLGVTVRDPNIDQALVYKVFVDFDQNLPKSPVAGRGIPAGSSIERQLEVTLPHGVLGEVDRCHRIELLVSSAFVADHPFRDPVDPNDLATAVWWVELAQNSGTSVPMSTCP